MARFDMRVQTVLKFTCGLLIGVVVGANPDLILQAEDYDECNVTTGDTIVLDCPINFPGRYTIPYLVTWKKENNTIYEIYDNATPKLYDAEFENRITRVEDSDVYGKGSINITNIQITDSGMYECLVLFRNRSPPWKTRGTRFLLKVEDAILTTTSSEDADIVSTDPTTVSMEVSASIGPPQDPTIHITSEGYLLSWSPPKYGSENLRVYVVRWFRGPHKYLVSSVETNRTTYLVKDLEEDEMYHFEVGSLSKNDYDSKSNMVSVYVQAYGAIRIAVAGVGCLLLLILIGAIIWYKKVKMHKTPKKEEISNENRRNGNSVY